MESLSEVNMYKQDIDAFMQKVANKHGHEGIFTGCTRSSRNRYSLH